MQKMKDSGVEWIGSTAEHWKTYAVSQLFSPVKCKNTNLVENNLLSLSYGHIINKDINTTSGLLPESFEGYNIIEPNDIVLRLTDLQNDHTSLRVGLSTQRGIITSAYLTLRCETEHSPRFLYYQLHSFDVCKGLYGMGAGVRQGLNWDGVKSLSLVAPSVAEQKAIVDFLDRKCAEIDAVIAKTKVTIEEYKKLKQSIITEAVTKGIRGDRPMKDSGVEWIGEIPAKWSKNKVFRLFDTIGSGTTPKSDDDSNFHGDVHWIQSGDINGGILTDTKVNVSKETINKFSALKVYNAPFIIIAMYGGSIGNTSISQINGCVNQACCVMSEPKINLHYAFHSIKIAKDYLVWKAVGGGQPNISQDTVKSLWLPVPPVEEQKEIADYLDKKCAEMDTLIARKTALLEEMESYKKSVIYEYVTGKKEVK